MEKSKELHDLRKIVNGYNDELYALRRKSIADDAMLQVIGVLLVASVGLNVALAIKGCAW